MEFGYALISEEHPAGDLVDSAAHAVDVGMDHLSISDHFHPWLDEQGQSPFAWTVLGALAAARDVPLMTSIEIVQRAFDGDEFSFDGVYNQVERARLYSLPPSPVLLAIAAGGTDAAELAGRVAAGLIAVDADADLITAMGDIPTPQGLAQATTLASPVTFRGGMPMGPDLDDLEDTIAEWEDAGFSHLALHNVGPYQRDFLDTARRFLS